MKTRVERDEAKDNLRDRIDEWIGVAQDGDPVFDMWISDSLVDAMTEAAWAVLKESLDTQEWLKREGYMKG